MKRTLVRLPSLLLPWVLLALPSCALTSSEIHLAPLFSKHRTASGGMAWEVLGGLIEGQSEPEEKIFAIHPIFRRHWNVKGEEKQETDFLYPLGYGKSDAEQSFWRLLPIFWYKSRLNENGTRDTDWIFFPFFGGSSAEGENYFAFFPLFGTLRDFLTFDTIRFFLFPLYLDTEKSSGRKSYNFLWPIFGYATGPKESGFRIFPLFSYKHEKGKSFNYSILWPFIHFGWEDKEENPGSYFLWIPFFGTIDYQDQKGFMILPPFLYGYIETPKTGYRAYDILWPLIKIVDNGKELQRFRVLPFYANTKTEEIESTNYLWPISWKRKEKDLHYERDSFYLLPFWQRWKKKDDRDVQSGYWQLWPLVHDEWSTSGEGDFAFPSPWWFRRRASRLDDNFAILWTLYSRKTKPVGQSSSRVWLNLYRHEEGTGEDRLSVPLLFARRKKSDGTTEWSFLAGLLRWRNHKGETDWMAPSFPGPGWEE